MEAITASSKGIVRQYICDVSQNRGKLIRPRLLIHMAQLFGGGRSENLVNCAACCELLHTASLIHDDVIDEAATRRGKLTLNTRYGNEIAVVVGDYLLALVFEAMCEEQDFELLSLMLAASRELGSGVIEEVANRNNFTLSVEKYYDVIYLKTASLFSLCTRMGAYLGGADARQQAMALEYGRLLGLAFQVVDDLLDLTLEASSTGKPAMIDIKEGRITLPLIHALIEAPDATRAAVEAYQAAVYEAVQRGRPGESPEPEGAAALKDKLAGLGSLSFAYAEAGRLLAESQAHLAELAAGGNPAARAELQAIAASVIEVLSPSLARH
jgi:octaprenyl-diphosphate synthase